VPVSVIIIKIAKAVFIPFPFGGAARYCPAVLYVSTSLQRLLVIYKPIFENVKEYWIV
jgi:hypothetical protein